VPVLAVAEARHPAPSARQVGHQASAPEVPSTTEADGQHRRLDGGAVVLAERQQARGRAGLEGGAAGDGGAGGEDRRRPGAVVDARHHHGVDQAGRGRIGAAHRCRGGGRRRGTGPCR
jgi:hypothetical protein